MALGVQISSFSYVGAPVLSDVFGYFKAASAVQIQRVQIAAQTGAVGGNVSVTLINAVGTSLGAVAVLASGTDVLDYLLPAPITLAANGVVRAQFTGVDNGTASDLVVNLIGATSQGADPAPSCCGPDTSCLPPQGTLLFFQGSVAQEQAAAAASATAAAASATAAAASATAASGSATTAGTQANAAAASATTAGTSATTATTQAGIATAAAASAGVSATNASASAVAAAASAAAAAAEVAAAFKDACVVQLTTASTQTIANATATAVAWNSELFDDNGFWAPGAPTRLTVPAGVSRVRLSAGIRWVANATGERKLSIRGNPAGTYEANAIWATDDRPSDDTGDATIVTPIIPVAAGDYFEVIVEQDSTGNLDINTATAAANRGNFFCIQVIKNT